ncbi:MAG: ABC transporter permease, partial [Rhodoluna sp.]
AMNSTQLSALSIVNGIMIASTIRTTITVFIFEAVLLAFGAITWASVLPLAVAAIMVGAAFAAAMLATAARVINDDGFFAIVGRFIIAPMMLFSGTYYPLSVLPLPLQAIGWISPLWHATQLGRVLSYGLAVPYWLVAFHVFYLVALGVTGIWLAKIAFEKRLG